jgi:hypothetical protein
MTLRGDTGKKDATKGLWRISFCFSLDFYLLSAKNRVSFFVDHGAASGATYNNFSALQG